MQQSNPNPTPDLFDAYQINKPLQAGAESFDFHLRTMGQFIHRLNLERGWWTDLTTGQPIQRSIGKFLLREMDDKLPLRPMFEVELADDFISLLNMAEGFGVDLPGAVVEKLRYNFSRPDHDPANRKQPNGKKY
jgi:hypothetical protein